MSSHLEDAELTESDDSDLKLFHRRKRMRCLPSSDNDSSSDDSDSDSSSDDSDDSSQDSSTDDSRSDDNSSYTKHTATKRRKLSRQSRREAKLERERRKAARDASLQAALALQHMYHASYVEENAHNNVRTATMAAEETASEATRAAMLVESSRRQPTPPSGATLTDHGTKEQRLRVGRYKLKWIRVTLNGKKQCAVMLKSLSSYWEPFIRRYQLVFPGVTVYKVHLNSFNSVILKHDLLRWARSVAEQTAVMYPDGDSIKRLKQLVYDKQATPKDKVKLEWLKKNKVVHALLRHDHWPLEHHRQ
jgi:hypothetical protein